ncbi:MAG: methyltransferase domain-containing protein [Deltaproteobacteria bacterium]|nr:methyltransferase domain-containing protein [Deltaproteobacteria bacterium]
MRESFLELLVEPTTYAPLTLERARREGDVIESGALVSTATGKTYPIVRGIPRFVSPSGYTDSFGLQWNRFREVQVDSTAQTADSRRRFLDETGWTRQDLDGRTVLDAGCGAGRFAEISADLGARLVALDMSSAVEAAKKTLAPYLGAEVVQASLLDPPFRPGTFDYAYCIGVVQHTPAPPRAIRSVIRTVKPGGRWALTIYARRPWTKLNAKYLVRPITKRLPKRLLLKGIESSMPVVFPVTEAAFRIPILGKVAEFAIPVANYVDRTDLSRERRYREAVLDTFDMLSPAFDSPMTWQEADAAIRDAGAVSVDFRSKRPIVVRGRRG